MKKLLFISICIICFVACGGRNSKLQQHYIKKSDIDVTFRFDKPINGYDIVMHWQPFEYKGCETGTAIVDFYNENGLQFQYINDEKFSTHFIYDIVFDETFAGFKNGDEFTVASNVEKSSPYPGSPLDYYLPFQFYDVDFDGEKELLVNDWGLTQCGNCYTAYEITDKGLVEKIEAPLNHIDNMMTFDPSTNDIIARGHSGAWYSYELTYTKKNKTAVQKITIPNSFDKHLKDRLEEFASDIPTEFYITNAHIKLGDQHYDLIVKGNKWQINN